MRPEERPALRELCAAATAGPWLFRRVRTCAFWYDSWVETADQAQAICGDVVRDDGLFIAQARTVIPALLDALDTADAELARLREQLAEYERVRQAAYEQRPRLASDGGTQPHALVRPGCCAPDNSEELTDIGLSYAAVDAALRNIDTAGMTEAG